MKPLDEKQPERIVAFDPKRKRRIEVDLEKPFFQVKQRPDYPACDHRDRGVTLDVARRKAICLCGVEIDNFDALLIYAHAQRRLVSMKAAIDEHNRKEHEKKYGRAHTQDVTAWGPAFFKNRDGSQGAQYGYDMKLRCGHEQVWEYVKRRPPRRTVCKTCVKLSKLKEQGVAVVGQP